MKAGKYWLFISTLALLAVAGIFLWRDNIAQFFRAEDHKPRSVLQPTAIKLPTCTDDTVTADFQIALQKASEICHLRLTASGLPQMAGQENKFGNLKILDLSNHNLTTLPFNLSQFKSLEVLDLSNNSLKNLPSELLELKSLKLLLLTRNPISAEDLKKLREAQNQAMIRL